jgi:hypothetical protein
MALLQTDLPNESKESEELFFDFTSVVQKQFLLSGASLVKLFFKKNI